jgi:hypothetical protein
LLSTGLFELPSNSGAGEVGGGLTGATEASEVAEAVAASCIASVGPAVVDEHPAIPAVASANPATRMFNR